MRQRTGTPFPPMCSVQMIASGQYTEGHRWAPARVRAHHRRERSAFFASASARACAPPTASLTLRGTPKCLARASNVVRLERAREGRSRALRVAAGPPRATRLPAPRRSAACTASAAHTTCSRRTTCSFRGTCQYTYLLRVATRCRGTRRDNDLFCVTTREQGPRVCGRCSIACDTGQR